MCVYSDDTFHPYQPVMKPSIGIYQGLWCSNVLKRYDTSTLKVVGTGN